MAVSLRPSASSIGALPGDAAQGHLALAREYAELGLVREGLAELARVPTGRRRKAEFRATFSHLRKTRRLALLASEVLGP